MVNWGRHSRNQFLGRVGAKGELFPPKRVREVAGIKPGDLVLYRASKGRIEVIKIPSLREAFKQEKFARISFEELEKLTKEVLGLNLDEG